MKQLKRLKFNRLFVCRALAVTILSGFVTAFACDGGVPNNQNPTAGTNSQNLARDIIGTWRVDEEKLGAIKVTTTITPDGKFKEVEDHNGTLKESTGSYEIVDNQTLIWRKDKPRLGVQIDRISRMNVRFDGSTMTMSSADFPDIKNVYKRL